MGSHIWSRDIICLHILLHRKNFLCSKICKQIMSLDQMRDPIGYSHLSLQPLLNLLKPFSHSTTATKPICSSSKANI